MDQIIAKPEPPKPLPLPPPPHPPLEFLHTVPALAKPEPPPGGGPGIPAAALSPGRPATASPSRAAAPPPREHQPMLGSSPVHVRSCYSYLSSERMWHENHSGLYNLATVILVAANFR